MRSTERGGIGVVVLDEELDLVDRLIDIRERAASDGRLGDDAEPSPDLVEPRGIGECIVDAVSWVPCEPCPDLRMLVGNVVVGDEVDIEVFGDVGVE